MGRIKIPYYIVDCRGAATGARTRRMRTLGFQIVRCGARWTGSLGNCRGVE